MLDYPWPGNVRELKNTVERMVITSREGTAGSFVADMRAGAERLVSLPAGAGRLRKEMERVEREVIEAALKEHGGEINATWRSLGISRRALYERMKKYGIARESFRES
jgi:DNA-binding NtrC family response regulator